MTAQLTASRWSDRPRFYYLHERSATFQDLPHAARKPPHSFRIGVVGDSFSFGPYLQFNDTFPKRLERMLNLNDGQPTVEVINYGVPRYSTSHEIAVVQRAILEQTDLIILQITLNDPEIKSYRPDRLHGKLVDRFGQIHFSSGVFHYWKAGAFVLTRLYNAQSRKRYIDYFFDLFEQRDSWQSFERSVERINQLTNEAHIKLVAVIFPLFGLPLDNSYPFEPLHSKVRNLLIRESIPAIDLLQSFRGIPPERLQAIVGKDFHPNEIGHRIASEKIYRFLAEEKMVPPECVIKRSFKERLGSTIRRRSLRVPPE